MSVVNSTHNGLLQLGGKWEGNPQVIESGHSIFTPPPKKIMKSQHEALAARLKQSRTMNSWEMDIYLLPPCCLCLPSPSAIEELGFPRFFSFPLLIMFTLSHCCCASQCYSDSQYLKCFKSNMLGASESSFCRYRFVRKSWSFVLYKWVEVVGGKLWERLGFSFQWLKAVVRAKGPSPKLKRYWVAV